MPIERDARLWRRLGACLLLGMTLALSACGGDDHDSGSDSGANGGGSGGGQTPTQPDTPADETPPQLHCAP